VRLRPALLMLNTDTVISSVYAFFIQVVHY